MAKRLGDLHLSNKNETNSQVGSGGAIYDQQHRVTTHKGDK